MPPPAGSACGPLPGRIVVGDERHSFQAQFHLRWRHLDHPHVRALAWLLESPDLLDPGASQWEGKIASIQTDGGDIHQWLTDLDCHPADLDAWMDVRPFTRLGRYAEQLLAFYLNRSKRLIDHGVQVRGAKGETIGEFDFLLNDPEEGTVAATHWEFATKFYLLHTQSSLDLMHQADYFIGPNLADTLGAKVRKILDKQLMLAQHPAAREQVSRPIRLSQAVIKGWLFYRQVGGSGQDGENRIDSSPFPGLSDRHCRGFWCTLSELDERRDEQFLILPRLSWLAPARDIPGQAIGRRALQDYLAGKFRHETMPVLVACVSLQDDFAWETDRGFIVPDDWMERAGQRVWHESDRGPASAGG